MKKEERRRNRERSLKHKFKYWIITAGTMGTLIAYSAGKSHALTLARVERSTNATQEGSIKEELKIEAGLLEKVIDDYQKQTGWIVLVPNEKMRSMQSSGVTGNYTPLQALEQILRGTGLSYKIIEDKKVTLEIQATPESVDVRDRITLVSSPKYTEPLRDIPQTITVIPGKVIAEQGATTLRDVLQNVPGITIAAGEGGAPAGDNLTLRGFSARNDIFIDGVRDIGPQTRDPFNLEQVEVIKGPASAYTGRGSTGGVINLVSKTPTTEPFFGGTLSLGTDRTSRGTADINLPLGDRTALRFNAMAHDSRVAGREAVTNERWGIAPSITFGLGTPTRLTLSYLRISQDNTSDYGIPFVPANNNALSEYRDRPAPVPRYTFYGFRNRDFEKLTSDLATIRFERSVNDNISVRNQLRYGRSTRDSMATPPRFASPNSTVINREMRAWNTEDDIWDNQTDLSANFSTFGISHRLVSGLVLTREDNLRRFRTAPGSPTTLLDPNPFEEYTGVITTSPNVGDITGKTVAVYLFDTAEIHEKFELTGGVRWDRFKVDGVSASATALTPVERVDRMLGWRAGAVFKPTAQGSIYASVGTSLNPSLEGLSYGTASSAIGPEKSRNYEMGSKWDLFRHRLLLSGSIFRVEKTNARTPGILPGDPPQVLQGLQRVNGLELSATGSIKRWWTLLAAYTLLDSSIRESNNLAEIGRRFINTPRHSFSLWSTFQVRRFEFGGGARRVSSRFSNTINTRLVEGHTVADLMVGYRLTPNVSLRLNAYNVTDTYYFERLGGGHVVPGPGRSAVLSTSFRF